MNAPIIVLEGLDACGKSTQTEILLENLKGSNLRVAWKRFPGYETTPAGKRIAAYLAGEFGDFHNLDPKLVASLYAADRLFQLEEIEKLRAEHDLLVFDRGVTSNLIYTPARAKTKEEEIELIQFVKKLEYEINGFPTERLVIFLDASFEARAKIHQAKGRTTDLHESDETYLKKVREVALDFCKNDFRWVRVSVDRNGDLKRREAIAQEILGLVLEKLQKKA
ncbi:MAG TPA: hypothetical protein VIT68_00430 [Candidatus Gracilibacteria bacterium]